MKLKKFLIRILFCLPFIAIVFYINSYHGELINNANVEWKYIQNDRGKFYLALDVYSPSGIKIDIFSGSKEITNFWKLTNYPKKVPRLYLPYKKDFDILYATEKYTFLYEWSSESSIPSEDTIKIKYKNTGTQNYYNAKHISDIKLISNIDFSEIFRHIVAIIFIIYFVLICKITGALFIKKSSIVLDNPVSNLVVSIFLGIIFLTYLFFIIGILKLLYFPIVLVVLLIILFFGFEYNVNISGTKTILMDELKKIITSPWKIFFSVLLLWILIKLLFYNFSYCFIPAISEDGSGDITNSYLPILNDYIISHSFTASIQNSTIGINSQATDILRTIVKMFSGEAGVYLLSFVYLLLIIGSIYLICKELFNINSIIIYLSLPVLLILSADLFTGTIHFGKHHTSAISFLLISLYSIRFSDNNKNYILPALFFAFLSSQYIHFIIIPLIYYFLIFIYFFYKRNYDFKLYLKSFIFFSLLFSIFHLKLIIEIGTCFPSGMVPAWISDFFLRAAEGGNKNDFYKYIDNDYIRHFHWYQGLQVTPLYNVSYSIFEDVILFIKNLDFSFIFLFFPFLSNINRHKVFYIFETIVLVVLFEIIFPGNWRLKAYYIFPLVILQIAIISDLLLLLRSDDLPRKLFLLKRFAILVLLFVIIFDVSDESRLTVKFRKFNFLKKMNIFGDLRGRDEKQYYYKEVLPVFWGLKSKYQYLHLDGSQKHFDHAMLIRQYIDVKDTILIVPIRYHNHTNRIMTARHALGSVIYQKDIKKIMEDLKKLNIKYLSTIPIHYKDYNPFYTQIFEEHIFYKYFKLLFKDNGSNFYKIIYDGSNTEYYPSPYNVKGLPFVSMFKDDNLIKDMNNCIANSASIRFFDFGKDILMEIRTKKSSGRVEYEIPKEKYKGNTLIAGVLVSRIKNCSVVLSIDDGIEEIKGKPTSSVDFGVYEYISAAKKINLNSKYIKIKIIIYSPNGLIDVKKVICVEM